jgi:chromate reductase
MRILAISGSTRTGSFNTALARLVAEQLPGHDVSVEDGLENILFYNADVEAQGIRPAVTGLRDAVRASDLVVLCSPEYNGTTPGVLMNAIEWLSRPHREAALSGRTVLVIGASPTPGGGRRSAAHLRAVLDRIGSVVVPVEFNVARAHEALAPGTATRADTERLLRAALAEAIVFAEGRLPMNATMLP